MERDRLGASRSGFITCWVVVQWPQFLRQQQLHFIQESVIGGPEASGAGSCHLGGAEGSTAVEQERRCVPVPG